MTEYELQKAICKYLDLKGVLYCGSMGGQYQAHFSQRIKAKKSGYKNCLLYTSDAADEP